ncbi:MAG: hypothetical protein ACRCTE_04545 [Cellulosilyticaceae bacterium]
MKSTKFMAGALVLSIGLLGTGYAYWTDALTVGTTVSTGELRVEYIGGGNPNTVKSEYVETEKVATQDDTKEFKVKIGNMYPGASNTFNRELQNFGTIPAQIDTIEVGATEAFIEPSLLNALEYKVRYDSNNEQYIQENFEGTGIKGLEVALQQLEGRIINPEKIANIMITVVAPTSLGNEYQTKDGEIEIVINWKQENAPKAE